ncbi:YidC/Oxa1 family membrane protein insertase [Micromonospora fluostatini]
MLAFAPFDHAVGAAGAAVHLLAGVVEPLAAGGATAAAIVLFTVAVRLLISPLTVAQVRGERRRAALAPAVRDLRHRYADDPARQQRELVELYRSAGASPVAGCLPALLQAPFFILMYQLFTTADAGRSLLAEQVAGVSLGHRLADGWGGAAGPLFGVLLAVLTALAWWSSRRMRRAAAATGDPVGGLAAGSAGIAPADPGGTDRRADRTGGTDRRVDRAGGTDRPAGGPGGGGGRPGVDGATVVPGVALLGRVLPLLPYATVLAALVLPLAAVLYLVTTTAWTALEQVVLRRPVPQPTA